MLDAATGEVVATIAAQGPDATAILDYARTVGGARYVITLQRTEVQGNPALLEALGPERKQP